LLDSVDLRVAFVPRAAASARRHTILAADPVLMVH
jgi:hypothetical protein